LLPDRLRAWLPTLLASLAAVFALLAALVWHGHRALGLDVSVQRAFGVADWSQRAHQHVGDAAAALGSAPAVVVGSAALAVAAYRRRGRDWAALALTGIALPVALAVDDLVKPLVGRRYYGTGYRFPSGHAATVSALVVVAWLLLVPARPGGRPRGNEVLACLVGLGIIGVVSWGLLVTRTHSPIDIVGGWAFGAGVALAAADGLDALARVMAHD
jgi:membrane-associated phospholipid phosphatase